MGGVYLGIDPGKDGAIVALDEEGIVRKVMLTRENFTIPIGKGSRREYDSNAMGKVLTELHTTVGIKMAVVEKQQARPGQGGTSMFSIGVGYGLWLGILGVLDVPLLIVHPKTWQKTILRDAPGVGKGRAVLICKQRIPSLDLTPGKKRKPHDGIADAACIAMYGLKFDKGSLS